MTEREAQRKPSPPASAIMRGLGVAAILGIVGFFFFRAPTDRPPEGAGGSDIAPIADGGGVPGEAPETTPRCSGHGPPVGYRIGREDPAPDDEEEDAGAERLLPFAVELGRGARIAGGFAVGVKHDAEDGAPGSFVSVAVLDGQASKGELVKLGRSRGDMDAPLVVSHGDGWVAALLEPNAGGLALRLVRKSGDQLDWGAELEQGRDESLAYDVAFGARVGVVAWDDVSDDGERAMIMLTSVTSESLEGGEDARAVSGEAIDAELPRVTRREGGFWLSWVARARAAADDDDAQRGDDRDRDGRYAAENIVPSWIELTPLDEDGKPMGAPRAITPQDGHVLAYDVVAREGGALVAWRDDDTPSGAGGGKVRAMLVSESGGGREQLIADEDVGAGTPTLLGGWLALPDASGHIRLAPLAPDGEMRGALQPEAVLGSGQLLSADGDVLLLAKPDGKSVYLTTVRCDPAIANVE